MRALFTLLLVLIPVFSIGAGLAPETQDLADRGMEAVKRNEWDLGIKYFKEAAEKSPSEPSLLFNLALAYDKSGRSLAADLYYRTYLSLEPDGLSAEKVRKRVAELDVKIETEALTLLKKSREILDSLPEAHQEVSPQASMKNVNSMKLDEFYRDIFSLHIRRGDLAAAKEMVPAIPGGASRKYVCEQLAMALAAAGRDAEAFQIKDNVVKWLLEEYNKEKLAGSVSSTDVAESLIRTWDREMSVPIARGRVERGDFKGAIKLFAEAGGHDYYYSETVEKQAQAGDMAGAMETVSLIKSDQYRVQALCRISRLQAGAGDIQAALENIIKAEEAAKNMASEYVKPKMNMELASSYAAAGKIAEAIRTRDAIMETAAIYKESAAIYRDYADIAICTALARSGAGAEAKKRVSGMFSPDRQFEAYRDISYEQAKTGDVPGAESTIGLIQDRKVKLEAKSRLAEAQGKTREAHCFALQAIANDKYFQQHESLAEGIKLLKAEDPKGVVEKFINQARIFINSLYDMRKVDAKWKK